MNASYTSPGLGRYSVFAQMENPHQASTKAVSEMTTISGVLRTFQVSRSSKVLFKRVERLSLKTATPSYPTWLLILKQFA
jgi:hypothetical protein